MHKRQKTNQDVLLFLDGFVPGDDDLKALNSYHYLSTSAGCNSPSGEQEESLELVILSAWQKKCLGRALVQQQQQYVVENEDDVDERLEEIFFHTGGRIREAIAFLKNQRDWIGKKKKMISAIHTEMAKMAATDTKSNISEKSVDRLRTLFRAAGHPGAHQIVDSRFYARELRLRLGAESFYNAFQFAVEKGLMTAAGCHFEERLLQRFACSGAKSASSCRYRSRRSTTARVQASVLDPKRAQLCEYRVDLTPESTRD